MIYFIRCAIIFSILVFANCEQSQDDVIELAVHVYVVPPNNIEFQFEKNDKIEPVSLREGETVFYKSESDTTVNFRDPKVIKLKNSYIITVSLEYRYAGKEEIFKRNFQHEFRHNTEEVIIVRFPSATTRQLPQAEICSSGNCESIDSDVPKHLLLEQVDAPRKSIDETYTEMFIDRATLEESCENDCGYSEELLNTALQHGKIGTHLLLRGLKDTKSNPVDTIRTIIFQDLDLPHLEYNILQAKHISEGLVFEMETTKDVIEILRQAQVKEKILKEFGFEIALTTRSFYDDRIDVRFDDS